MKKNTLFVSISLLSGLLLASCEEDSNSRYEIPVKESDTFVIEVKTFTEPLRTITTIYDKKTGCQYSKNSRLQPVMKDRKVLCDKSLIPQAEERYSESRKTEDTRYIIEEEYIEREGWIAIITDKITGEQYIGDEMVPRAETSVLKH